MDRLRSRAMTRSPIPALCAVLALALAVVLPAACSGTPPNVGSSCSAAGGCDTGLSCDNSVDGGYCTTGCITPGSTSECPEQSVCDSIGGGPKECLRLCTGQADCRADLQCNGVTGSALKACRPQ